MVLWDPYNSANTVSITPPASVVNDSSGHDAAKCYATSARYLYLSTLQTDGSPAFTQLHGGIGNVSGVPTLGWDSAQNAMGDDDRQVWYAARDENGQSFALPDVISSISAVGNKVIFAADTTLYIAQTADASISIPIVTERVNGQEITIIPTIIKGQISEASQLNFNGIPIFGAINTIPSGIKQHKIIMAVCPKWPFPE
jgi:hypothetical protein